MPSLDVVFDDDGTPIIDVQPIARANLVYDADAKRELLDRDWRADQMEYKVPRHLRLPPVEGHAAATECTEANCRKIENLIISGVSPLAAKATCSIPRDIWKDWQRKAKNDQGPYWHMMERVKLAMAFREAKLTRTLGAAAEHPDATVAMKATEKMLAYTNPQVYAPKSTKNVNVNVSGRIDMQVLQAIVQMPDATGAVPRLGMRAWTDEAAAPTLIEHNADADDDEG